MTIYSRSEELVPRCVECNLAEPESLASLGGSAPGLVDGILSSQCHSSEDLDQALQAYQAYQVQSPQDSTTTPERSINHHFTYHIAQASQAKHGSLIDRGANDGLAG